MITILGISAFYHDSAAALIIDGKIVAAAQEERFSRKKHDARYPHNAINFILKDSNLKLNEILIRDCCTPLQLKRHSLQRHWNWQWSPYYA